LSVGTKRPFFTGLKAPAECPRGLYHISMKGFLAAVIFLPALNAQALSGAFPDRGFAEALRSGGDIAAALPEPSAVPAGTAAPDEAAVRALLEKVSAAGIRAYAERLTSFGPRNVSALEALKDSGNKLAMDFAEATFGSFGLTVRRQCYMRHRVDPECNIIGTKQGAGAKPRIIVVIGHLDTVGNKNTGADDNASGVAGMLETARVLSGFDSDHTMIFVASNGEERGMSGSKALAKEFGADGLMPGIDLAVDMDMIGWNADRVVDIETDKRFEPLAGRAAAAAKAYTSLKPNINTDSSDGDHVPFLEAGVPGYLSIEHWKKRNPCYHKSCDTMDRLDWDFAAEVVKMNLAVIAGTVSLTPAR